MTLVVDDRRVPYYAVMVQGTAEIGPRLSDEARLRMAIRYLGEEWARAYTVAIPAVRPSWLSTSPFLAALKINKYSSAHQPKPGRR